MLIAEVSNKEIVRIGTVKQLFPNVSFGPNGATKEFLDENNCRVVLYEKEYNKLTERLEGCTPYYESGRIYGVKSVALTGDEIKVQKDAAMSVLKSERNRLLKESDWTQVPDSTADKKIWGAYRKALRDFPKTVADARIGYTFPEAPKE